MNRVIILFWLPCEVAGHPGEFPHNSPVFHSSRTSLRSGTHRIYELKETSRRKRRQKLVLDIGGVVGGKPQTAKIRYQSKHLSERPVLHLIAPTQTRRHPTTNSNKPVAHQTNQNSHPSPRKTHIRPPKGQMSGQASRAWAGHFAVMQ